MLCGVTACSTRHTSHGNPPCAEFSCRPQGVLWVGLPGSQRSSVHLPLLDAASGTGPRRCHTGLPIPALRAAPPAPRPPERPQHRPGAGVASGRSLSPVSLIANGPDDLCVLGGRKLTPFSTAPLPSSVGRNSLHSPDIDPMLVSDSAGVFMHLRLTRASRVQTNWEALQPRLVSPSGGSLPVPSPQATRPALLRLTLNGPYPFLIQVRIHLKPALGCGMTRGPASSASTRRSGLPTVSSLGSFPH